MSKRVEEYKMYEPRYVIISERLASELTPLQTAYSNYIQNMTPDNYNTLSTLSTNYKNDSETTQYLSSILGINVLDQIRLQPYLIDATNKMSTLSLYSIAYTNLSLGDTYYSTLEGNALSTVRGYSIERDKLTSSIQYYDDTYNSLHSATGSQYTILIGNIDSFYSNALTNVQNVLLSYEYQIQEWSAFIGSIVCQLLIQKTYIAYEINDLHLYSFTTISIPDRIPGLAVLEPLSSQIDTVIGELNTIDISFNDILRICSQEMTERGNYIGYCKERAYIEAKVTGNINTINEVWVQYGIIQGRILQSKGYIDSFIGRRLSLMGSIMNKVNPQLTAINTNSNIKFDYTSPDPVSTDSTPFANDPTEFEIFTPLDINVIMPTTTSGNTVTGNTTSGNTVTGNTTSRNTTTRTT
jgi:hypothetical protein